MASAAFAVANVPVAAAASAAPGGHRLLRYAASLLCLALLLRGASGAERPKARKQPQRAKTVTDLFHTPSCANPPFKCPYPRIEFYLYTRATQDSPDLLDLLADAGESLNATHFDGDDPTKVIIHGFGGGRKFSPSPDIRKAYFTRGEYNIIIVDYSSLVIEPCLSQVEWSPRFCALCIAQLVGWLEAAWLWSSGVGDAEGVVEGATGRRKVGAPPEGVHIIGYSVGAHIAGLVSNYVGPERIGRITGLDPTIIFYMGSNRSRDLDPSDALFVDIIHTGAGVLGQLGPNGHVDFYVNGGSSQPGCAGGIYETLACDHQKVTPYFIESINSKEGFWAAPCPNLLLYLVGWCTTDTTKYIKMGEDVPRSARGIYYLETNARKPYAKGHPVIDKTKRRRRS